MQHFRQLYYSKGNAGKDSFDSQWQRLKQGSNPVYGIIIKEYSYVQ